MDSLSLLDSIKCKVNKDQIAQARHSYRGHVACVMVLCTTAVAAIFRIIGTHYLLSCYAITTRCQKGKTSPHQIEGNLVLATELKTCYPSQPFVVLTVDQLVGHGGGPLERQRQDNHVYRKTGTLPLNFRKNQSRHYINDEV